MTETNSKLEAALSYAALGWAVFPIMPGAKKPPLTPHGFKDASKDSDQIRAWWTAAYPDANIGVATGATSGITVLDVDVKPWKGKHGDKTLAALVAEHDPLPLTPEQRTWSGGLQYIFKGAEGVGNSAGALGAGLDIRGDGGYIVVPPSTVEEDDRSGTYVWARSPFDQPLAPMPEWLLERVKSAGAAKDNGGTSNNRQGWPDGLLEGVPEGSRDQDCVRLIGRYVSMRPPLSENEVLAFMLTWAEKCRPPFPEELVHEKVERFFASMATDLLDFPLTDAGNAERMVALFGDRFRWVTDREEWLAWDGRRWAPGREDLVKVSALDTARAFEAAVVRTNDDERPSRRPAKKFLFKHGLYSESARGISNAVQVARLLNKVWVEAEALDTNPDLLNVGNGTLDLRTFELRPHDRADMLTRVVDVPYEPQAQAPLWHKFLRDVFCDRHDVIEYVQRAVGYTLTGSIEEQCFFLLHGGGANGKSTFVAVLTALLGEYATKLEQEAILSADKNRGRGATPELVVLVGRRLAYVDELEEGRQLDEARVKALTGSERATGRALYQNMQEWTNTAKLWMDLNHLPTFKGIDFGIERRPRVIPFDRRFEDREQDKRMAEKLLTELPGILAWMVEGCRRWRDRGLDPPEAVSLASRRYRDDNNHLPAFVEDQYVKRPGAQVPVSVLKKDYEDWCMARDESRLDYQRKVLPFLEQVWKLTRKHTKTGGVWVGIAQRRDVEQLEAALAGLTAGKGLEPVLVMAGEPLP